MKVAIMYSGGKDSTYAIDFAKEKGWEIAYLLSVKPTRTDCFLYHFATVEMTKDLAQILGIRHIYTTCNVADPVQEAEIVKRIVVQNPVDAVILGGTGLQMTQIRSIQNALRPYRIEVFAAHSGLEHDDVMQEMLKKGYKFMISQVASYGLNKEWLGRVLDKNTMDELFERSKVFGFHAGGEGGYYDTLVLDGPIFSKRLDIEVFQKVMESENCGHIVVTKSKIVDKIQIRE
ncbi:MAG TPA: diphthine--ammonia ligase [Candidatus Nanoarchaeia archaeon]|nr:diphthine--ammonia ligase [Candidatus Nanoarchaeia archaeon]